MLIIDTCNIGVGKNPGGGFALKLTDIEGSGFLNGMEILIPIYGESAQQFLDAAKEAMGPSIKTATLADMPKGAPNVGA